MPQNGPTFCKIKFAIQVNSSPYHSQAGYSAYQFICAALAEGHEVLRVFFYHEGIYHAFKYATPPDDEPHFSALWRDLAQRHQLDLAVCISAAQRRGLLCADEAARQGKPGLDVCAGFRIAGLSQLFEAIDAADRFIVFG